MTPATPVPATTPARLYTFRGYVWGRHEDTIYLRDPAGLVGLSVPWDGERIGDELTVTIQVGDVR